MTGISAGRTLAPALALLAWSSVALAQPARDPAAAEALFERGKALMDQGKIPEACDAFAGSQRLDPAGGTLLRLALCHEAQGKLASSWVEFTEVVRVSREGTGEPAKLQERVRIAKEHMTALEPRVPKLTIVVGEGARAPGLSVTSNGLPRDAATWGVPLPVDPGDVTVRASAPARRDYETVVHVGEGAQLSVEVPALTAAAPPPIPPPAEPHATGGFPWRPLGIGLGVAGVVALGVGTYFGVRAIGKWNDANGVCPGSTCTNPAGVSSANDAKDAARISDFTLLGGGIAVAACVVLYLVGTPSGVEARPGGVAVGF